jgi:hypothetical protein
MEHTRQRLADSTSMMNALGWTLALIFSLEGRRGELCLDRILTLLPRPPRCRQRIRGVPP